MSTKVDRHAGPCNFDAGIARFGGKADRYRQLLRRFVQDHRGAAHATLTLLQSGDLAGAEKVAHSLKGVAGNLAVDGVSELAARIVTAIRAGDPDSAIASGRELQPALEHAVESIEMHLAAAEAQADPQTSAAGEIPDSPASVEEDLQRLRIFIAKHDVKAIDLFNELKPALGLIWSTRQIMEFETLVGAYRFAEAQEALERA